MSFLMTLTVGLTALTLSGDHHGPPALSDAEIAHIAVTANQLDVEAARQALDRSADDRVRDFARTMIRDHEAVIAQAAALAGRLGVEPADNEVSRSLVDDARSAREGLARLSGREFDRAYMANEVAYHQAVITAVRDTLVPATRNAELRQLLEAVLPALEGHLTHARQLADALGGEPS